MAIAREVTHSVALDDHLLRFANDGSFDVTTFDRAELPGDELFQLPRTKQSWCPWASWATRADDRVRAIRWEEVTGTGEDASQMLLSTIDLTSNPPAPHIAGPMVLKHVFGNLPVQAVVSGEPFAFVGSALASYRYLEEGQGDKARPRNFVDIAAIDDLAHGSTKSFELPAMITGLLAGDGVVATSHAEPVKHGRVRFYLDRFDVSDPKAPRALPQLNIPGSLMAINAQLDRAITVDHDRESLDSVTCDECARRFGERAGFSGTDASTDTGTCERRLDTIHLVSITDDAVAIEDSFELPHELQLLDATARGVIVAARAADKTGHRAVIVRATPDDSLEVTLVDLNGKTFERPAISDSRAFLIGLASDDGNTGVLDLSAPHPNLRVLDVPGPVQHVSTHEDTAFFSLGQNGLAAIDLSETAAP